MRVQKGPLKVEEEIKILQSHKTELQSYNQKYGGVSYRQFLRQMYGKQV